jgi:aminopeptidase-like protein
VADRVALHVLQHRCPDFIQYRFLDRGSDERQYCSPGVDLPMVSVMRSKYGCYPEYHTSLDDLELITPTGLDGGYEALRHCLLALEQNRRWQTTTIGEPQLGRRGLRPTLSTGKVDSFYRDIAHLLAYADGHHDLLSIASIMERPLWDLVPLVERLQAEGLLREVTDDRT